MNPIRQVYRNLISLLKRPAQPKNDLQAAQIQFLLNEVSDLRSIVRHLTPGNPRYARWIHQTQCSFEYQWQHLSEGRHLASDPLFRENAATLVCQLTRRPEAWFPGKRILDAGCGNGRWSLTFCEMGSLVTAMDVSAIGVRKTDTLCRRFPGYESFEQNLLERLPRHARRAFDLVYAHGVVHHTGDTWRAVQHIAEGVQPGGYLYLMVYGEPRGDHIEDYSEVNNYVALRRRIGALSNTEKVRLLTREKGAPDLHGWFDATSPRINDLHRFDEVVEWLQALEFEKIRLTVDNRNLNIIARYTGT